MPGPPELHGRLLVGDGALAGVLVELVFVLAALWFCGLITSRISTVFFMEVHMCCSGFPFCGTFV
jgi:hypothetical protein